MKRLPPGREKGGDAVGWEIGGALFAEGQGCAGRGRRKSKDEMGRCRGLAGEGCRGIREYKDEEEERLGKTDSQVVVKGGKGNQCGQCSR